MDRLYAFAERLDATLVRTGISRSVIDPNRDPSGASLYPGQATTELCPTSTFDGELLYRANLAPGAEEIASRRSDYFVPYHGAIAAEIARLRARHAHLVVYDCHSIRSQIPRLFSGLLPHLNLGTFSGASCAPALTARIEALCDAKRLLARHQRALQGRLHHAPLRAATGGGARGADGARLPCLSARAARGGARG